MTDPSKLARRVEPHIYFDGHDISVNMRRYLTSLTYTDVSGGEADDLVIEIDDREGVWANAWLGDPGNDIKGLGVSAALVQKNWYGDGKDMILECGSFELDHIDFSGPPGKITISATALPFSSEIRMEKKTKAWEAIKLSAIAAEIASGAGFKLLFESALDPLYSRSEQIDESDIAYLESLCKAQALSLKAGSGMLVIFDEALYESKPPAINIEYGKPGLISYSFSTGMAEIYQKCHVAYQDPVSGDLLEGTFTAPQAKKDDRVLEIKEKVSSSAEAKQLAEKRLREHNKGEFRTGFSLTGNVNIAAGMTAAVTGFGMFDGKYIIEKATHSLSSRGYITSVELHRTLEGY